MLDMSLQHSQDVPLQDIDAVPPSEQSFDLRDLYLKHALIPGQASIRVLDLKRQRGPDSNEPLRGTLRVIPLDSAIPFDALSYVWGQLSTPSETLCCSGVGIAITANLHAALTELRRQRSRTIWIDAVCINQNDEKEKTAQIPLMGDVYSQA